MMSLTSQMSAFRNHDNFSYQSKLYSLTLKMALTAIPTKQEVSIRSDSKKHYTNFKANLSDDAIAQTFLPNRSINFNHTLTEIKKIDKEKPC